MTKQHFELSDETSRLLEYYAKRTQKSYDEIAENAIKLFISDRLSSKQLKDALQHKGKDAFPAEEVLRNFADNWMRD